MNNTPLEQTDPLIKLADYAPYPFKIIHTQLLFELDPARTIVEATLQVQRTDSTHNDMWLDGEELDLQSIKLNATELTPDQYVLSKHGILIKNVPSTFKLETIVAISPNQNTRLEGLYYADGIFCTQCEANGFRRITFYPDRPDCLSKWNVSITAPKNQYPVLLSNGNRISSNDGHHSLAQNSQQANDLLHHVCWQDPFYKPAYLFALAGGKFDHLEDQFMTMDGRNVTLGIYCDPGTSERAHHAMQSLKDAMRWDEKRFGLSCDLDMYNIVATNSFNMGAMENKGLNIFNAKYVLVDHQSATDRAFDLVSSIIAHEYFHNWTGNRITLRDWFQLSLKEGLTVFRDQEFTSDTQDRAIKRIDDVQMLRKSQFEEDSSPLAHPVRPKAYRQIDNFYTATVYEKGAELIRMMHTILGETKFMLAMDQYIQKHDGSAATCEDFFATMESVSDGKLKDFFNWYEHAGTPQLLAKCSYIENQQRLVIDVNVEDKTHHALPIPIACRLLDSNGNVCTQTPSKGDYSYNDHDELVLIWRKQCQSFVFDNIQTMPVAILNRQFSAPVKLQQVPPIDPVFILKYEHDPFVLWDQSDQALHQLAVDQTTLFATNQSQPTLSNDALQLIDAIFNKILHHTSNESKAFHAKLLEWPTITSLMDQMEQLDIIAIAQAVKQLWQTPNQHYQDKILDLYQSLEKPFEDNVNARNHRALQVALMGFIFFHDQAEDIFCQTYDNADNMSVRLGALRQLTRFSNKKGSLSNQSQVRLDAFYEQWAHDEIVIDHWFSLQSTSPEFCNVDLMERLMQDSAFSMHKPNKVYALLSGFAFANPLVFHQENGDGYDFMGQQLLKLDQLNPQVAARLAGCFSQWKRFKGPRKNKMHECLQQMLDKHMLSTNMQDIIIRTLD